MAVDEPGERSTESPPLASLQAALVLRAYFVDRRSKVEIAQDFGISRFRVARLIEAELAEGRVRIEIDTPAHIDVALSLAIQARYELKSAVVAPADNLPPDDTLTALAAVAAPVVRELLHPADVMGIGWGRTLARVADLMTALPGISVVQLMGGSLANDALDGPGELARKVAQRTAEGDLFPLHAPFLVASAQTAKALLQEPLIIRTVKQFERVAVAILGVGTWDPPTSGFREALSPATAARLAGLGIVADFCAQLLTADGTVVRTDLDDRIIAMPEGTLRSVPHVVAIAGGPGKVSAIKAVLRSGLASVLVTDSVTARALL